MFNFVLTIKFSRVAVPSEYGFMTREAAENYKKRMIINNSYIRWCDIEERNTFKYADHPNGDCHIMESAEVAV